MIDPRHFEFLFNATPVPCLILAPEEPLFTIREVNAAYCAATGSTREDLLGKGIFEAFPGNGADPSADGVANLRNSLGEVLRTRAEHRMKVQRYDIPVRGRDEFLERYWSPVNRPVQDEQGNLLYIIHSVTDVTAQVISEKKERNARRKLTEKRELYRALFDNNPDPVYSMDLDGRFLSANEKLAELLECPLEDLHAQSFLPFVAPDEAGRVMGHFSKACKGGIENFRATACTATGKRLVLDFTNLPIIVNGEIIGVYGMAKDITESVRAAEQLQASEDRYRYLFHRNPVPMWIYDMATARFLEVNQAATEKYGYSREEFLEMTIMDIRPKEDIELLNTFTGVRTDYGTQYAGHWRHLRKDGELMYVEITSHLIEYNGAPASLILSQDVTAKVRSEEAIRRSEEVRTLIMNSALDAIVCMDHSGNITLWNDQAEKIFGWKREEMLGKRLSDYILPERARERHEADLELFLKKGKAGFINQVVETAAINKQGVEFPVEVNVVHIRQRATPFFCAYIRDITERKHHLAALDRSEKRYRTLVQEGSDLINILDENGNFRYVSPTCYSQLGYTEQDLQGQNALDLVHPDDQGEVAETFRRLQTEKRVKSRPFRYLDAGRSYRWIESVATNLLSDPSISGILINSKDITERMNYIRAIEEQNERLREIAWTQSHVVRAPLARIMGIVHVLTSYPGMDLQKLLAALLASAHELDEQVRLIVKSTEKIKE